MPREDRRISFDFTETYKAIFTLCMQNELPRPFAGSITALSFKAEDDRCVVVRFANGLQGTSATSEYSRDFLAAALMLYCRTCHIPIPKKAMKSVELGDDAVTLRITLGGPVVSEKPDAGHFNQKPRRKAAFVKPLNILKAKAGYGGLNDEILNKAQAGLENNSVDFQPLAEMYLSGMMGGIERARNPAPGESEEVLITGMLYPAMQLKAGGAMCGYPLVTRIADKQIQFLEVIAAPDKDAIDIVLAFHTTVQAVLAGRVTGSGGKHGDELMQALEAACLRYFEHYPDNRSGMPQGGTGRVGEEERG